MSLYRKKPVVIEAFKLGEDAQPDWFRNAKNVTLNAGVYLIETKEGIMEAHPGSYVIKGVEGELYPCDPQIFVKTYDPVKYGQTEVAEHSRIYLNVTKEQYLKMVIDAVEGAKSSETDRAHLIGVWLNTETRIPVVDCTISTSDQIIKYGSEHRLIPCVLESIGAYLTDDGKLLSKGIKLHALCEGALSVKPFTLVFLEV